MKAIFTKYVPLLVIFGFLFCNSLNLRATQSLSKQSSFTFAENHGQWDNDILFAAEGNNVNLMVTEYGLKYDFYESEINGDIISIKGNVVSMNFRNGAASEIIPLEPVQGRWNYFYGNNPDKWIKNSSKYESLLIKSIYNGIDAKIMFDNGNPRYDFIVNPGADPKDIQLSFSGAEKVFLDENTNIVFKTSIGEIYNGRVYAYQIKDGIKREVKCGFEYHSGSYGFYTDDYDRNLPLIIDPVVFASYLGGNSSDEIIAVCADDDGYFYVCGWTQSSDFVTTEGAYQIDYFYDKDVFVSKFLVDGFSKELVFSTLIGSNNVEYPTEIDIDMNGNIYISGSTSSADFPNKNGFGYGYTAGFDCFLTKFNSDGSEVLYSSVFGGSKDEVCTSFKVTDIGYVYAVGYTMSSDFPIKSAYQNELKGSCDAFFLKTNKSGSSLENCTFFGGNGDDKAYAMSIDNSEKVYFTGYTMSDDFPAEPLQMYGGWYMMKSPYDHIYNGGKDAFVTNMTSSGGLIYSTFFGGKNNECGTAINGNNDGSCYFAGWVESAGEESEFPVSQFALQKTANGKIDGFIAQMDALREEATQWPQWKRVYQDLIFSTYLGGSGDDHIHHIEKSIGYNALILCGKTDSPNFYNKYGFDFQKGTGIDAFFTNIALDASEINSSTIFGGNGVDAANSFAIDKYNNFLIAGVTSSDNFPQTNEVQESYGGGDSDGFFLKYIKGTISFNSPIPGDDYCKGSNITIRWTPSEIGTNEKYRVEIKKIEDDEWTVLAEESQATNIKWEIPESYESGEYQIRVSHVSGATVMMQEGFIIKTPPSIISLNHIPESLDFCEGESVTFTAITEGDDLEYKWRYDGVVIEGANTNQLILTDMTSDDTGLYDLIVSGACNPSVSSEKYNIQVMMKPVIISQSEDISVREYEEIRLSVEAEGDDLEYLWKKNGELILGADKNTYVVQSARMDHKGQYQCIVKNDCGEIASTVINVNVEEDTAVNDSDKGISNDSF